MRYLYWFVIACLQIIMLTSCGLYVEPTPPREAVESPRTNGILTSLPTRSIDILSIDLVSNEVGLAGPPANNSPAYLQELEAMVSFRRGNLLASPGWVKRLVRLTIELDGELKTVENETSSQVDENGLVIQVIEPQARAKCSCQGGFLMSWARTSGSQSIWDMQPQDIWTVFGGSQLETNGSLLPEPGIRTETVIEPKQAEINRITIQGLEPGQPILLDFGFSKYAQNRVAEGARLQRQTIYENCWYLSEQYTLVDQNQRVEALFNPDTGKLRRLQVFDLSQKDIRLLWRIDLAVEE